MDKDFKNVLKDAKNDNIEAKIKVAEKYESEGKDKEAFRWYLEIASEDELPNIQVKVGDYYFDGMAVKQDYNKAYEWYFKAADLEDSSAAYKLSHLYKEGLGVEKNLEMAFLWCDKAASLGHVEAMYELGLMYRNGLGINKNNEKSFSWFKKASDKGHVNAKVNVGYCYCNGIGVEVNSVEGVTWYKQAAEEGNATALFNLGMCYKAGFGIDKDIAQAIACFEEAGRLGHGRAFFEIGQIYENEKDFKKSLGFSLDYYQRSVSNGYLEGAILLAKHYFEKGEKKRALQWLEKGIENKEVQFELGKYYFDGIYVEQNYIKAIKCFSESAKKGNPIAQYYMGLVYYHGYGVKENLERAIECFKISSENNCIEAILILAKIYEDQGQDGSNEMLEKAAKLNDVKAMYKLGYNYAHGKSCDKDMEKAIYWYKKAAELNDAQAQCNLALCYLDGNGVDQNAEFGIYWLERAASGESAVALLNLGYCYANGVGVEQNDDVALSYFLKAANKNNGEAKIAVANLYKDKDYEQAIYWYNQAICECKDEAYIGLAEVYINAKEEDINKVKILLDGVEDKTDDSYASVQEKFEKYLKERE